MPKKKHKIPKHVVIKRPTNVYHYKRLNVTAPCD
ncbi:hypothetical protein TRM7615_02515 [Falsiruegeria mediterranea M17]|jgi:hypothetical protein|uniref:Uncharacterized protein n=1 Tax=Falsiruegeria mediterranea M17 TaxID=1200281 RepID=A0A2R8C988_9RHOB|nr:hypothetical protein TRM7615_02515 [Falsiruegeria mediterranea M17]